jgi:hypothetical protein
MLVSRPDYIKTEFQKERVPWSLITAFRHPWYVNCVIHRYKLSRDSSHVVESSDFDENASDSGFEDRAELLPAKPNPL